MLSTLFKHVLCLHLIVKHANDGGRTLHMNAVKTNSAQGLEKYLHSREKISKQTTLSNMSCKSSS